MGAHKSLMFPLEVQVLPVESVHAVNHGLHQLYFGVAQTVLVADIVGDSSLSAGLTTGTTGLQVQLLATFLQCRQSLLSPSGQVNVDRGSHASAQVGGAGVQVAVLVMQHEVLA